MEQPVFWAIEPEDLFEHDYQRLAEATRSGDTSLLLSLLQEGARTTPSRPLPTASLTPLAIEACIAGENDALEILLEHDPAQTLAVDPVRRASPLHWAAHYGDSGAARLLLNHGARPDILDREGLSPLHYAAEAGRRAMLDFLVGSGGAVVDSRAAGSEVTPLILAAGRGHLRCVEYLIIHNADVSAVDALGRTALIAAAMEGREAVARALLKAGADPLAIDAVQRRNALHWASQYGWTPVVEALLEANSSSIINVVDSEEETPLLLASRRGFDPIVALLLQHGAAVDAANRSGVTSLAVAALFSQDPVVAHLLGAGAGIQVVDRHMKRTPLHQAALGGSAAVVSRLLRSGARADVMDASGLTPRELAIDLGDEALVDLLSQL